MLLLEHSSTIRVSIDKAHLSQRAASPHPDQARCMLQSALARRLGSGMTNNACAPGAFTRCCSGEGV
jgi:hypothetical protein